MQEEITPNRVDTGQLIIPVSIALAQFVLQSFFHAHYGYFRDELYYIACSKHLALGYVDQPPLSLAILAAVRWIFGDSLQSIRLLPALAISATSILAALMVLRFKGGQFAAGLASLSVVAAPVILGQGRYFSMNSFDILFWAAAMYVVVRIMTGDSPKLWLVFGIIVGLGLENKYSVGFLCIGLFAGMVLTSERKHLFDKWFWLGAFLAFLLFLPHVIWEWQYGFPSLEFMRNASQQKNVSVTIGEFVGGQLLEMNYFCAPVWLLGLFSFFFDPQGRRYRLFAWAYVAVFIIMVMGNGKAYYLSPIYPLMLAGGAVFVERMTDGRARRWLRPTAVGGILVMAAIALPFAIPVLPVEGLIKYQKLLGIEAHSDERTAAGILPQYYADEFGWEEMTAVVASAYNNLSPEEQTKCVIYVRNYGEAAAIDFFGPKYGLPGALCAHNSYWFWGPGVKSGDVAIIFGSSRNLQDNLNDLGRAYTHVELAATLKIDYVMPYENGRQVFICRGMNTSFQKIWPRERFFI
jgi:4-amino-4-deoxy-L-arabinose transferase-like glycosyltransferase